MRTAAIAIMDRIRRRLGQVWPTESLAELAASTRYFVHIPKTAGMTVHAFLAGCKSEGPCALKLFPGFFLREVIADLSAARRCNMFAGHFLGFLDPLLGRTTEKATLLRDPVERAISHFLHVRRDPAVSFHAEFREKTLAEVLATPALRGFASNVQARYLAAVADDGSWLDHTMQVRVTACDDEQLLDRASAGLELIKIVGLHSDLPAFMNRLAVAWNIQPPESIPWENAASNRDAASVTSEEIELLSEMNRVDQVLYEQVANNLKISKN